LVKRIVIYGYAVPNDRIRGPGSGVLIDLTYFVDDDVRVEDVFNIIQNAGCKLVAKYVDNDKSKGREVPNRVDIEDWEDHIRSSVTVGSEQIGPREESYDDLAERYFRNPHYHPQGRY